MTQHAPQHCRGDYFIEGIDIYSKKLSESANTVGTSIGTSVVTIYESNNQIAAVVVNRNQDKWLSEVFVSLGEDEELASGLLIMKGLAFVSQATDCPNGDALRVAEELVE